MQLPSFLLKLPFLLLCLFLGACAGHPPVPKTPPPKKKAAATANPAPVPQNYWHDEGVSGPARIVIALGKQRAYFYKGKNLVGESTISTGRKGFETPPGTYKVLQKDKDHVSNLYGEFVDAENKVVKSNVDVTKDVPPEGATFQGAKMPYFMRFHSGYGLHAGRVPNYRASHGCVRLPRTMAEHFFDNSSFGTPVVVEP